MLWKMETNENKELREALTDTFAALSQTLENYQPQLRFEEIGTISFVGNGIARIKGLDACKV